MHCHSCREEIIGAVNRCWKCGQPISPTQMPTSEVVTIEDEPVMAIVVDSSMEEGGDENLGTESPFQASGPAPIRAIRIPAYRNPYLGLVCSWISVVLGATAFSVSFVFPLGGSILAVVAIVVATIGMRNHSLRSSIGAALCVLALISSVTMTALHHYAVRHGRYPWQSEAGDTSDPIPIDDGDFDEWN